MKPDIVVDVGNSRIKWGRCADDKVVKIASLSPNDEGSWEERFNEWKDSGSVKCAVAGVNPEYCERVLTWLRGRSAEVRVLDSWRQLGLEVLLPSPEHVGIDRLLNAVAAKDRVGRGTPLILV